MDPIVGLMDTVKLARKQSYLNLALFPLLAPDAGEPDYLTLEEALERGAVEVTEVSEGGSGPELKLINRSGWKVLVVDGEELVGAKQNRIVNATFLIDAHTAVVLPVSCVEEGRWSYRTSRFTSGKRLMPSTIRGRHVENVAACLYEGRGFRSNQSMIWQEIEAKASRLQVRSSTGAMSDLFEGQRARLEDYLRGFRLVDCQAGAVFAINGRVVGLELFGHHRTFGRFFEKLLQSYALDALEWVQQGETKPVSPREARRFVEHLGRANEERYPSLGLGENVRLQGRTVTGSALVVDGRVLHLCAFKQQGKDERKTRVPLQRYSRRRDRL